MVLFSVATLAALLALIDVQRLIQFVRTADPRWLLGAAVLSVVTQMFAAWRLQEVLRFLQRALPAGLVQRIHFVSLLFNQILPTGLGGDVVRVLSLRTRTGWTRAVRAVLLDRAYGLAMLILLVALQAPVYFWLLNSYWLALIAAGIGLGGVLAMVVAVAVLGRLRPFWSRRARFVYLVAADFRRIARTWPSPALLAASLMFPFLSIVCYALLAQALGMSINVVAFIALVPLIFIIMQIPISFGGWGPREAASVAFFTQVGYSNEQAFALAVLFGLALTIAAIPGVVLLPGLNVGLRGEKAE